MATDWRSIGSADDRDRISSAIADERRRLVLAVLAGAETPVSLGDLASRVARREVDQWGGRSDRRADAVHVELYHKDVPKLADIGLVDWDRDRDAVRPGPVFQDALLLVDALAAIEGDAPATPDGSAGPSEARDHRRG